MTGRPELRLIRCADVEPVRGLRHWLWLVREAAGGARWRLSTAVAALVATLAPRVRGQAWAEGFAVAHGNRTARTWRVDLPEWRAGNEVAHEIRHRRRDGRLEGVCRPFVVPSLAALSAIAAEAADEQMEWLASAQVGAGGQAGAHWSAWRRILGAAAAVATSAVDASHPRVAALPPVAPPRRIVVVEGRPARPAGSEQAAARSERPPRSEVSDIERPCTGSGAQGSGRPWPSADHILDNSLVSAMDKVGVH